MNPALTDFERENKKFQKLSDQLERKLAAQFDLAFDECVTTTGATKLMLVAGTIILQPVIVAQLEHRFFDIVKLFSKDLDEVKIMFDRGVKNIDVSGYMALPVALGQPPVAGTLKWIRQLRERLLRPSKDFVYLDYP